MATETNTRKRKPRTNYTAEHDKLSQYCKISIDVMEALTVGKVGDDLAQVTTDERLFLAGQISALRAILRQIGEAA